MVKRRRVTTSSVWCEKNGWSVELVEGEGVVPPHALLIMHYHLQKELELIRIINKRIP